MLGIKNNPSLIKDKLNYYNNMHNAYLLRGLLYFCIFFVFLSPLVINRDNIGLLIPPEVLKNIVGQIFPWVALILLGGILLNNRRSNLDNYFGIPGVMVWVFLFIIWGAISITWSLDQAMALKWMMRWISAGALLYLIFRLCRDDDDCWKLLYTLFVCGLIVALIGLYQNFNPDFTVFHQAFPPAAVFGNKNFAASFMLGSAMLGIPFLLKAENTEKRWIIAICLGVCLSFIFYTVTRGTILSVFMQLLFIIFCIYIYKKKLFNRSHISFADYLPYLGVVIVFFCLTFLPSLIETLLSVSKNNIVANNFGTILKTDTSGRIDFWSKTFELLYEIGFGNFAQGWGLGNWMAYYMLMDKDTGFHAISVHNILIEVFVELGIIGFLLFVIIFIGNLKMIIWSMVNYEKANININLLIAVVVVIIGIMFNALFSPGLRYTSHMIALIVSWGILMNIYVRGRIYFAEYNDDKKSNITVESIFGNVFKNMFSFDLILIKCGFIIKTIFLFLFVPIILYLVANYNLQLFKTENVYYTARAYMVSNQFDHSIKVAEEMDKYRVIPKWFAKLLNIDDNKELNYAILYITGLGKIHTNDIKGGIEDLENHLKQYPYHFISNMYLTEAYYRAGDMIKFYKMLKKILNKYPGIIEDKDYINYSMYFQNLHEDLIKKGSITLDATSEDIIKNINRVYPKKDSVSQKGT